MKYIFVCNKNAGQRQATSLIKDQIQKLNNPIEYEIYETKAPLDATRFVLEYCDTHKDKETCFVACGGDGTINEVASALVNQKNKYLAVFACGSGNDLIKYYKGKDFLSIDKITNGTTKVIDILKVTDLTSNEVRYSINVCNIGLSAVVCAKANQLKDKGKTNAYNKALLHGIIHGMKNKIDIEADGKKITNGELLICDLANHQYVGGKYFSAPNALCDDGLIDLNLFLPVSLLKFAKCLPKYEKGLHNEFAPKILGKENFIYEKIKKCHIYSDVKPFDVCIDGEMLKGSNYEVEIMPKSINFIIPKD